MKGKELASNLEERAKDPRLEKMPRWVYDLVQDLAKAVRSEQSSREWHEKKASKELEEARKLLNAGPADSDTFMALPSSMVSDFDDEDADYRPLGNGVTVEFRPQWRENERPSAGDGFRVRLRGTGLQVASTGGPFTIKIQDTGSLIIE